LREQGKLQIKAKLVLDVAFRLFSKRANVLQADDQLQHGSSGVTMERSSLYASLALAFLAGAGVTATLLAQVGC
jgi:hypothetical protein